MVADHDVKRVGSYILVSAGLGRMHVIDVASRATLLGSALKWVRIGGRDHRPALFS
jgi:hypothetical protein